MILWQPPLPQWVSTALNMFVQKRSWIRKVHADTRTTLFLSGNHIFMKVQSYFEIRRWFIKDPKYWWHRLYSISLYRWRENSLNNWPTIITWVKNECRATRLVVIPTVSHSECFQSSEISLYNARPVWNQEKASVSLKPGLFKAEDTLEEANRCRRPALRPERPCSSKSLPHSYKQ